ncbi:unnamed protein product [Prorocentrum cordatum]|uniref:Uncharacterized protein n=1 Tax=Prorocentrum cordatum TaxID=2364126 RepID=A0ABN9T223_9DINO|nr:unnamed protein product [Polarella glacialis]
MHGVASHPRGVALDAADCLDRTALHHAARGGHLSACEALLADPGADASLWAEDFEGLTALHYAAIGGHAQVCRLVVEHPSFQRAFAEGAVNCEWLEQAHGAAHDVIQTALDQARRAMEAEEAAQIHGERRWAFEVNRPLDRTEEQANRLDLVMELFRLLGSGARRLGAEEQLHLAQLLGIHTTAVQWHGLAEHAAGHWWDEHGWEESPGPSFSQFERFIDDEDSPGHCRDDELQRILDRLHAEGAASTTLVRPALPGETRLSKQDGAAGGDAVEAERSGSEPLAPRTPERVDDPALSMGPSAAEGTVPARSRTAAPPTPEARAGSSAPKAKAKAKPRSQRAAPGQAGAPDASAPQPAAVAPELQQPAGRAGAPPPGLAPAPGAAAAAERPRPSRAAPDSCRPGP